MTYPRMVHPELVQPGQAELMGAMHEMCAVRSRQGLREFTSEYRRDLPLTDMHVRGNSDPRRLPLRNNDMADFETTHFEKMGDSALEDGVVNVSGVRSAYMQYGQRRAGGPGAEDNTPGTGSKGNRTSTLQPADVGPALRIATVLPGGQPDMPRRAHTVRGPYRRNAAVAASPDPGPVIVEDDPGWR